ncbi:MAG: preprotein translocase subunit SecG [Candidatus Dojkabacteria bacterium]|nr:preprotein translocase subunit SecG [Candidatus Dojkabacteria bacterium]
MEVSNLLKYLIVIVCVLLSVAILLQNRSGGLGVIFGGTGGGEFYRSKRGIEKFLYNSTIILAIILVFLSIGLAIVDV